MTKNVSYDDPRALNTDFLQEYSSNDSLRRYSNATAGNGIDYLLEHDYKAIYMDVIDNILPKASAEKGLRLWEFGCGAGMNLLHLVKALDERGVAVDCAIGTDFSEVLIDAANRDARNYLTPEQNRKVRFCVASHSELIEQTAKALGVREDALVGTFHMMLGVNTIRYAHRLNTEDDVARKISRLLSDRGVCVVIDMNTRFPVFRSRFRDRLDKTPRAYYLPSLDTYARPFSTAGLSVIQKRNFSWIPHSAGRGLTLTMRALTPILNTIVPDRAMRSLVIAQKRG